MSVFLITRKGIDARVTLKLVTGLDNMLMVSVYLPNAISGREVNGKSGMFCAIVSDDDTRSQL